MSAEGGAAAAAEPACGFLLRRRLVVALTLGLLAMDSTRRDGRDFEMLELVGIWETGSEEEEWTLGKSSFLLVVVQFYNCRNYFEVKIQLPFSELEKG
jgi:hypothetical protein